MRAVATIPGENGAARWLAAVCFWLALSIFIAPNLALAHAALVSAEPVDGTMLADSPAQFSLSFSEPVSPLVLTLIRPNGEAVSLKSFRLRDQTIEIDNPEPLAKGTHVLSYRVISADGHPVGGSLLFSVGAASAAPSPSEAVDWTSRSTIWLARALLYAGLFLGVGGAFCLCWLSPDGQAGRRFSLFLMLLGFPVAILSLGLQGLDALGVPLARLPGLLVWQTAFGTTYSLTILIALVALALGLASLFLPCRLSQLFSLAGLAAAGIALAASGHASAAEPQWLTRPMVFFHGAGIAFWAGALVPLGLALKSGSAEAQRFLHHFSRTILPVVAILTLAGVVLAIIQLQQPAALVQTAYGRLLLAKLALLAVLFSLAAFNRWRLTLSSEAGEGIARKKLVRSITAEMLLVLAIFGIAAGWRFTPPPRALAIAAAQPAVTHIHTLKAMAEISVTPGHAGPVTVSIVVMSGDFGPLDPKQMTLVLSKPDSGIEPLKRPATRAGDGTWRVENLVVPVAGQWMVRLDILVSDFEMVKVDGLIDIRP